MSFGSVTLCLVFLSTACGGGDLFIDAPSSLDPELQAGRARRPSDETSDAPPAVTSRAIGSPAVRWMWELMQAPVPGETISPGGPPQGAPEEAPNSSPNPGPGSSTDPAPAIAPCRPLALEQGIDVGGFLSDRYVWFDGECKPRAAVMVRNTQRDPAGYWGGYLRRYTYDVEGRARVCESSHPDHPGFGYLVNHVGRGAVSSRRNPGATTVLLAGRHHALHEFRWRYDLGGHPVTATVHWLFATGRSHPLWAVTFDTSAAPADALRADSRAPYGDLDWDGGVRADVDGVGWGDRYQFRSLTSPLTPSSGWDYSRPNEVPYVVAWSIAADAEMGLVQTQTHRQHDAGGYGFYRAWGTAAPSGPMPPAPQWTYQINQYELPFTTKSKRLAWGMNYGAVGQTAYLGYGDDRTLSGYPYQSYSVRVVLDRHREEPVAAEVAQVEAIQRARLQALVGRVRTEGPAGVGRSDSAAYEPAGYNPVYETWEATATAGQVDLVLTADTEITNPSFVIHDWPSGVPPVRVRLGERALAADIEYFATVDTTRRALWLTLPGVFTGATRLRVE